MKPSSNYGAEASAAVAVLYNNIVMTMENKDISLREKVMCIAAIAAAMHMAGKYTDLFLMECIAQILRDNPKGSKQYEEEGLAELESILNERLSAHIDTAISSSLTETKGDLDANNG